ncbi:MAG: hypothetical protein WBV74_12865 [Pseudonocardiaceae bacterium]
MPDGIGDLALRVASGNHSKGGASRSCRTGACGMDDDVQRRAVATGEVPGLLAAYRRATRGANRLRGGLVVAGLDPDELTVVAGLGEDGESVVHVTALPVVAVQLAELIADDAGPSPSFPTWYLRRGNPDVA